MSCQTTTNPVPISVQPGTKLNIICSAFAFFQQQVILSFNQNMSQRIGTFSGSGEQVPMHLANGQTSLTVSTGSNQTLFAQFNFSDRGPQGPFQPAKVVCAPVVHPINPKLVITSVTSEDATDNDDNDSYLIILDLKASDKSLDVKEKGNYATP